MIAAKTFCRWCTSSSSATTSAFANPCAGITPETRELLTKYDWPGNVRELKNAIERAMILEDDDMLRPVYLPFSVGSPLSSLTAFEVSSGGNVAAGERAHPATA